MEKFEDALDVAISHVLSTYQGFNERVEKIKALRKEFTGRENNMVLEAAIEDLGQDGRGYNERLRESADMYGNFD